MENVNNQVDVRGHLVVQNFALAPGATIVHNGIRYQNMHEFPVELRPEFEHTWLIQLRILGANNENLHDHDGV